MTFAEVQDWQHGLNQLGYVIPVTGVFDAATREATNAFKVNSGLADDAVVDDETTNALYTRIDALPASQDSDKPVMDIQGPQQALAVVGRAPSWLWWIGGISVLAMGMWVSTSTSRSGKR